MKAAASAVLGTFLALGIASTAPLASQERPAALHVTVLAGDDGRPVEGARVRVGTLGIEGTTAADGTLVLDRIPDGVYTVSVEAPGFQSARSLLTFTAGSDARTTFHLEMQPIPLASIDVEVPRSAWLEMVGFYERAEGGLGTFLPPDQVSERAGRATRLSDLLRALPGLRITHNGRAPGTFYIESRRGRVSIQNRCWPAIWLDGVPVGAPGSINIDAIASPRELLALEVYDGPADVPSAFRGAGGACGAILLWTGAHAESNGP